MHIAVLGGGPIGVEMAVAGVRSVKGNGYVFFFNKIFYFSRSGRRGTLIERGPELGSNVLSWGHVTLFSPNRINMSSLGRKILEEMGVEIPGDDEYLTGKQYVEKYLKPLENFLSKVCFISVGELVI